MIREFFREVGGFAGVSDLAATGIVAGILLVVVIISAVRCYGPIVEVIFDTCRNSRHKGW